MVSNCNCTNYKVQISVVNFNESIELCSSVEMYVFNIMFCINFVFDMQRYGCSIWRKDAVINTAEKKILLLLFTVGCVATINGVYYTIRLHTQSKLQAVLKNYMLCELSGYSMNSWNDITTCSKDELETYNYVGLSITSSVFTFIFLPLLLLLVMIEWRRFIQWMKVSFRMKETTVSSLSKLKSCNEMRLAKLLEQNNSE